MLLAAFGYGKHTKLFMPSSKEDKEVVVPGSLWLDNHLEWAGVNRTSPTELQDGVKKSQLTNQLQMHLDQPLKVQVAQDFLEQV